jgi:hydroxymethylglutaryl-CoA reductase
MGNKKSSVVEIHKLDNYRKAEWVSSFSNLDDKESQCLEALLMDNPIRIPYEIATNFKIDGKDCIIPMMTEEKYIMPAACHGGLLTRVGKGIKTSFTNSYMIGQIQICDPKSDIKEFIRSNKIQLLLRLNSGLGHCHVEDIKVRHVKTRKAHTFLVEPIVDTKDAMGARVVTKICEELAPIIEEKTGNKAYLRILSNLTPDRIATAEVKVKKNVFESEDFTGEESIKRILAAQELAECDIYRAATHNKGILNGVIAVALATGNDPVAIDAGVHAYAAMSGEYKPLTEYYKDKNDNLVGKLEIPLAVGTVGGGTNKLYAQLSKTILNVKTGPELARKMAAVGLALNVVGLYKLTTEGIEPGHQRVDAFYQ